MVPGVIKTQRQHEAALQRIDALMGVERSTPENDELELLATLVELYEDKTCPIALPDPIEAIRFRMEQAGLRQRDLVPFIGSASKVSEVLNGRRPLSLRMIRALHQGLGIPAEVLLQEQGARIPDEPPGLDWSKFPFRGMLKAGWFPDFDGTTADAREHAEELMRPLLAPIVADQPGATLLRQHVRLGSTVDEYALMAWRAKVLLLAGVRPVDEYEPDAVDQVFMERLVHLSYLDQGPTLAQEFLSKNGIALVVLRHLSKTHLDGAAMLPPSGTPIVALTLRHDRLDNFWFSLCHELAHVSLHLASDRHVCFLDDLEESGDELEDEADRFAADSLIPPDIWEQALVRTTRAADAARAFAASRRIHPAIVAGRIRRDAGNYRILSQLVGHREARRHFPEAFETHAASD